MNSDNDDNITATENISKHKKKLNKQKLSTQHATCITFNF